MNEYPNVFPSLKKRKDRLCLGQVAGSPAFHGVNNPHHVGSPLCVCRGVSVAVYKSESSEIGIFVFVLCVVCCVQDLQRCTAYLGINPLVLQAVFLSTLFFYLPFLTLFWPLCVKF